MAIIQWICADGYIYIIKYKIGLYFVLFVGVFVSFFGYDFWWSPLSSVLIVFGVQAYALLFKYSPRS